MHKIKYENNCDYEGCKKKVNNRGLFKILAHATGIPTGELLEMHVCDEHFKFSIDYKGILYKYPIFCATCGKQTDGSKFCSEKCRGYENLE